MSRGILSQTRPENKYTREARGAGKGSFCRRVGLTNCVTLKPEIVPIHIGER
jgi:hypothetical protein